MEFTIDTRIFSRGLGIVAAATETRTTIPILGGVLIRAEGECVALTGTDLDLGLSTKLPACVRTPGAVVAPAKRIAAYLRLLPSGDVLVRGGAGAINLASGRNRTRISVLGDQDAFPTQPEFAESDRLLELPAGLLADALASVGSAISREESRFTLNAALLQFDGEKVCAVAIDGHRMAILERRCHDPRLVGPAHILVPRRAFELLGKLCADHGLDDACRVSESGNVTRFEIGQHTLMVRRLAGEFPNWERVVPNHGFLTGGNTQEWVGAIKRARAMSDEFSRQVFLRFTAERDEDGALRYTSATVEGKCTDVGEVQEDVPLSHSVATTTETMSIGVRADYMLDALGACGEDFSLLWTDSKKAIEVRRNSEDKDAPWPLRYVIMPMG